MWDAMFRSPLVVLDFETSGMSPEHGGRVTELAALRVVGGEIKDRFVSLVNSGVEISSFITQLTGITQAMVDKAPPAALVIDQLLAFIGDDYLVAHNASFDEKFLFAEAAHIDKAPHHRGTICSVKLARRLRPGLQSYSLGPLAYQLGIKFNGRAHRAEADAEVTAHLMLHLGQNLCESRAMESIDPELLVQVTRLKAAKVESYLDSFCAVEKSGSPKELLVSNKGKKKMSSSENKGQFGSSPEAAVKSNTPSKPVRFRHYKGGIYQLVGEATQESDLSPVIVYLSHDGSMWTRPKSVFFEMLTIDGKQVQRFTQIDE